MPAFPHHYRVSASATPEGDVGVGSPGLAGIASAPPTEFGGPGDRWSPETLLLGALADCFVLSFRAVATASRFEWIDLECDTQGTLDRVDRVTRFTHVRTTARLTVPAGTNEQRARSLLEKAEHVCLISNSLNAERELVVEIADG